MPPAPAASATLAAAFLAALLVAWLAWRAGSEACELERRVPRAPSQSAARPEGLGLVRMYGPLDASDLRATQQGAALSRDLRDGDLGWLLVAGRLLTATEGAVRDAAGGAGRCAFVIGVPR